MIVWADAQLSPRIAQWISAKSDLRNRAPTDPLGRLDSWAHRLRTSRLAVRVRYAAQRARF
jgi:hypothetical protein